MLPCNGSNIKEFEQKIEFNLKFDNSSSYHKLKDTN